MLRSVLCCALVLLAASANSDSPSLYVGQESRGIKALSPQEISDYLSGKGMGLAKAAELNGYPGPAHVLELVGQLELTAAQRAKTQALFETMQSSAIALGKELVAAESALDQLFASRSVIAASLASSLIRIGRLQSQVRGVHLAAHLQQTAFLTPQQVAKYNELRGYAASTAEAETDTIEKHDGHGLSTGDSIVGPAQ